MNIALVTGSGGLIGSEAARFFAVKGFTVVGIDNDMRSYFFGPDASTKENARKLENTLNGYLHEEIDIRDGAAIERVFSKYGADIKIVIHTAAQPSHDWAAREPFTDFSVNATGTLNMLENTRQHCPDAVFIFTSTNKVYGDAPNALPLVERETRWELDPSHPLAEHGIDETFTIDQSTHSLFGASKVAADIMVQEYGRYFEMKTACFRGGCLTGPAHAGAPLHGFLAYLIKCATFGMPYTVLGYKGKQVRDNIHAHDLVSMFWSFYQAPRSGEVYNAGGGRRSNCSILEAITLCEKVTDRPFNWSYSETNRTGDHIWWISNTRKFEGHFPDWAPQYSLERTIEDIHQGLLTMDKPETR